MPNKTYTLDELENLIRSQADEAELSPFEICGFEFEYKEGVETMFFIGEGWAIDIDRSTPSARLFIDDSPTAGEGFAEDMGNALDAIRYARQHNLK